MKLLTDEEILTRLSAKAMIGGQGPALIAGVRVILEESLGDLGTLGDIEACVKLEESCDYIDKLDIPGLQAKIEELESRQVENSDALAALIHNPETTGDTLVVCSVDIIHAAISKSIAAQIDAAFAAKTEAGEYVTKAAADDQAAAAYANGKQDAQAEAGAPVPAAEDAPADWKPGVIALIHQEIEGEENGTRRNAMKDVLAKVQAL